MTGSQFSLLHVPNYGKKVKENRWAVVKVVRWVMDWLCFVAYHCSNVCAFQLVVLNWQNVFNLVLLFFVIAECPKCYFCPGISDVNCKRYKTWLKNATGASDEGSQGFDAQAGQPQRQTRGACEKGRRTRGTLIT